MNSLHGDLARTIPVSSAKFHVSSQSHFSKPFLTTLVVSLPSHLSYAFPPNLNQKPYDSIHMWNSNQKAIKE